MGKYTDQIIEATRMIVQQELSELKYDKTIKGSIMQILPDQRYRIKYNEGLITAKTLQNDKNKYKVGDYVLVKIPEGNFSDTDNIYVEGKIGRNGKTIDSSIKQSFFPISPNILTSCFEINPLEEYSLNAGGTISTLEIFNNSNKNSINSDFQYYSSNYQYLKISADFKTLFYDPEVFYQTSSRPIYGIDIMFLDKFGSIVHKRLDTSNFNGNEFNFSNYNTQSVILKMNKGYLSNIIKISFFQEFSRKDRRLTGFDSDKEVWAPVNEKNIFVKNLSIVFLEEEEYNPDIYSLRIETPKGKFFGEKDRSLILSPSLYYRGQDILPKDKKNISIHWFKKDSKVTINSQEYNKTAGTGWKEIHNTANNNLEKITDNKILEVPRNSILYEKRYKLVLIYEGKEYVEECQIVKNYLQGKIVLKETPETSKYLMVIFSPEKDYSNFFFRWYIRRGNIFEELPSKRNVLFIDDLISEYQTFQIQCDIFNSEKQYLGGDSYQYSFELVESENQKNYLIQFIGQDVFKYDTNGDISVLEYEKEYSLEPQLITNTEDEFFKDRLNLNFYVLDKKHKKIQIPKSIESALTIENSMMTNVWVDNKNKIRYNIRRRYQKENSSNAIIIIATDSQTGIKNCFQKVISFIKDGDQGTNGSSYNLLVRENKNKKNYYYPNDTILLEAQLYENGNFFTANKDIEYTWSLPMKSNLKIVQKENNKISVKIADKQNINGEIQNFIKCETTIPDSNLTLFYYYPIDIFITNKRDYIDSQNYFFQGPKYVQYSSQGNNPSFDDVELSLYSANDVGDILRVDSSFCEIKNSNNLRAIEDRKLFPYYLYKLPSENEVIFCYLDNSKQDYLIHTIIVTQNLYENNNLNNWDGTKLIIDDSGQYILSPQLGAGIKNTDNTFSGFVMGEQNRTIGLYGYDRGSVTFALDDKGNLQLGSKNNGIFLNSKDGYIAGGDSYNSANSLRINLYNKSSSPDAVAIDVNNGIFSVTFGGEIEASKCNLKGKIVATSGQIGDCEIDSDGVLHVRQGNIDDLNVGDISADSITTGTLKIGDSDIQLKGTIEPTRGLDIIAGTIKGSQIMVMDEGSNVIGDIQKSNTNGISLNGYDGLILKSSDGNVYLGGKDAHILIPPQAGSDLVLSGSSGDIVFYYKGRQILMSNIIQRIETLEGKK